MNPGVGGHGGDVLKHGFVGRWHEHLVNNVNDTVAGNNIGGGHGCVVDHHGSVVDSEGGVVPVDHGGNQTVSDVGGVYSTAQDVVGEDVNERGVGLVVVKRGEVNASGFKGSIGGGKDRERTVALEGLHQASMAQCGNQCFMNTGCSGVGGDVFGLISRDPKGDGGKAEAGNHEKR